MSGSTASAQIVGDAVDSFDRPLRGRIGVRDDQLEWAEWTFLDADGEPVDAGGSVEFRVVVDAYLAAPMTSTEDATRVLAPVVPG